MERQKSEHIGLHKMWEDSFAIVIQYSCNHIHTVTSKLGSHLGDHQAKRYKQAEKWKRKDFIFKR